MPVVCEPSGNNGIEMLEHQASLCGGGCTSENNTSNNFILFSETCYYSVGCQTVPEKNVLIFNLKEQHFIEVDRTLKPFTSSHSCHWRHWETLGHVEAYLYFNILCLFQVKNFAESFMSSFV